MISHRSTPGTLRREAPESESGAALVELGLILPFLVLILFGIVDFGWTYSKVLDVEHGAREGSRLAAVNYNPSASSTPASQADVIASEVCRRMGGATGAIVTLRIPTQPGPVGTVGQSAEVEVSRSGQSLTGLFAPVLNGRTLESKVSTRIEVKATWATGYGTAVSKVCP